MEFKIFNTPVKSMNSNSLKTNSTAFKVNDVLWSSVFLPIVPEMRGSPERYIGVACAVPPRPETYRTHDSRWMYAGRLQLNSNHTCKKILYSVLWHHKHTVSIVHANLNIEFVNQIYVLRVGMHYSAAPDHSRNCHFIQYRIHQNFKYILFVSGKNSNPYLIPAFILYNLSLQCFCETKEANFTRVQFIILVQDFWIMIHKVLTSFCHFVIY